MITEVVHSRFALHQIGNKPTTKEPTMNQTFTVTGMTCNHCEKAVTRAVKSVDPTAEVQIDRAANQVTVQSSAARELIAKAIEAEDYKVAA
jgi:copper chaperone